MSKEILKSQLENLKAQGLRSISIYPGDVVGASASDYYSEMVVLLKAIELNKGKPFKFNDSMKKLK